jgi:hypothetical protein
MEARTQARPNDLADLEGIILVAAQVVRGDARAVARWLRETQDRPGLHVVYTKTGVKRLRIAEEPGP